MKAYQKDIAKHVPLYISNLCSFMPGGTCGPQSDPLDKDCILVHPQESYQDIKLPTSYKEDFSEKCHKTCSSPTCELMLYYARSTCEHEVTHLLMKKSLRGAGR